MDTDQYVTSELHSLLASARSGCADAAARLLARYRPVLVLLAQREIPADLRAKADPSDIIQETLLAAHRGLPSFEGTTEAEFRAWLRQILITQTINLINRFRNTDKRDIGREISLDDDRVRPVVFNQLTAPDSTPSAQARHHEAREALHASLARLPDEYRQVILFRHQDRLSYGAIAQRLGKSEPAVRQMWTRAVKRLQQDFLTHDPAE